MAMTKMANILNAQLIADGVSAKLGNNIKLFPISYVQNLEGQVGGTIVVPQFSYIGDASDVAEGVAINPALLSQTSVNLSINKMATGIELSDEVLGNAYGSPLDEAEKQLTKAIANGLDGKLFTALGAITGGMLLASTATALSTTVIGDALIKFGEDVDGEKYLIVSPTEFANLRKDPNFVVKQNDKVDSVGEVYGCTVVVSAGVGAKQAYIVKPNALAVYIKKNVSVEMDRNILTKSTVITADTHYAVQLRDASGAIKITLT
jgi:N4-gp56 family major capsid protein